MISSLRLAGAAALCGALLLTTACAKKTDDTTSQSSTTQSTDATPAAATDTTATAAPVAAASAPADSPTTAAASSNGAGGAFIDLPVYPGATESKAEGMSMSANEGSLSLKVYNTKDDAKRVADWYKSHLPASWKGGVLTTGDKTVGTFSNEVAGGDQSVIIANQDGATTRIQLTTKHGK